MDWGHDFVRSGGALDAAAKITGSTSSRAGLQFPALMAVRGWRCSPKIGAPALSAEAGRRKYRDIAESALATATPDELRQLVLLFAGYADGLAAKVFDRNECCRQLLQWGKTHDRGRAAYFGAIRITHTILARALGLSPTGNSLEQREELLKLALSGLATNVDAGCPEVTWPDESQFPIREERPN